MCLFYILISFGFGNILLLHIIIDLLVAVFCMTFMLSKIIETMNILIYAY